MAKYHATADEYVVSRVRALESLMLEKGLLAPGAVDAAIARFANDTGPMLGARVTARAWLDPAFRQALLANATPCLEEFGLRGYDLLVVVPNSAEVHNLVVCTLCSCYPWQVMGLPPTWYKSPPYRSRAVLEPRALLAEMGLSVSEGIEIRVWDSSAEMRYMVLPERPAGTEGWTEDQLTAVVTRDHLVGVAVPPASPP